MSPQTISRLKVLGIGLFALLPIVGSYLLYVFWLPENHTNYGSLLDPRPVPASMLQLANGQPFGFEQLRGRWIFAVIDGGACDARCEEKLWKVRQVRQAQGKELSRIERVWLIDDGKAPDERLDRDYAGTWMVRAQADPMLHAFPAAGSNRDYIYLIDPLGNIMMRFPPQADAKRMIKDIGRLLKYSRIG